MSDTYFDLPFRMEDSFPEIDSDIVTKLRKTSEECADIRMRWLISKKSKQSDFNGSEQSGPFLEFKIKLIWVEIENTLNVEIC